MHKMCGLHAGAQESQLSMTAHPPSARFLPGGVRTSILAPSHFSCQATRNQNCRAEEVPVNRTKLPPSPTPPFPTFAASPAKHTDEEVSGTLETSAKNAPPEEVVHCRTLLGTTSDVRANPKKNRKPRGKL